MSMLEQDHMAPVENDNRALCLAEIDLNKVVHGSLYKQLPL